MPPEEPQQLPEGVLSPGPESPQTSYTIPTGRRPGTVPQMAIPATRTPIGTSGRHTAVELPLIDAVPSSRPQSSRSNLGLQIGRRRSSSFGASQIIGGRPRSNSIPFEEAYFRAPFHQTSVNDDEMLSNDVQPDSEDQVDDVSGEESYAPISAIREGFLDNATNDAMQPDHLKPPAPLQRHRSLTKASMDERFRSSKRRSMQNIQRRARSKSRSHRNSTSLGGDYFRGPDLAPGSPTISLSYPFSNAPPYQPSSPVNVAGDMNQTSMLHVEKLLRQMLVEEGIEKADIWQRTLMPILLKIADTIDPDVRGAGDDIDVRSYVKIKRLPGGSESDSTYVSGVVFTKNLALKRMPRTIHNPRIMLVTFPVEYHHSEMQLMSLDPMIAQGKEYIHNLVMRIVSHKPSVLVIGNSVSGIALDYLLEHGVSTLYNVKASVIEALSRCCEADIISSIDKLSSNPELGTCGQFSVRTSVHDLIPGRKKTLIYLNGCPQELGCTVVLRGGDMQTLTRVKRVLDFMVYVAYNLKLETSLMYDNMVNIPTSPYENHNVNGSEEDNKPNGQTNSMDSTVYDHVIREFEEIILSASPYVKFPPPELLVKAQAAEIAANRFREEHIQDQEEDRETLAKQEASREHNEGATENVDPEKFEEKPLNESQEVACAVGSEPSQESYVQRVKNLLHEYRHNRAIQELALRHKQWENFQQQSPELMNPLAHQNIIVLYSNLQKKTSVPCQGPDIHVIDYYSDTDCTLGQYVEDLFLHKEVGCEECEKLQHEHVRNYVHNHGRMNVFIEKLPCPLPGLQQSILMWSWCSVCELTMPVSKMSENSYRYSFGKWLELAFYAKNVTHRSGICPHDVYRYHVRYFGYDNWAVRFQYDSVDVLSLVVPDMRLMWEPEVDVQLKNEEKEAISAKVNRFFDSVSDRLRSISMDNIVAEKQEQCKTEIIQMLAQIHSERDASMSALEKIWHESMVLDRLPLNRVLKDLQDHVVHWDTQFGDFEKNYLPSDKDLRKLTAMQLRKLVSDTGIPFMDNLDRRPTIPDAQSSEAKALTTEQVQISEKPNDGESTAESKNQTDDNQTEATESQSQSPKGTPAGALDIPIIRMGEDISPSMLPSSMDSRISEISDIDGERRGKTLTVAPKIARLQAEIISPAPSPLRKPSRDPPFPALSPSISPPQGRSREVSTQSSESDDGPALMDSSKGGRSNSRAIPASKIPIARASSVASIHGKSKSNDSTSSLETRQKARNSIDESDTKPHKQFMSNTIKKLQRVTGTSHSVSSLAKHFDELSRQYEKEEIKRRKRIGYRRAFPVTSAKPKVEVFSNPQDAVQEASDDEDGNEMDSLSVGHSRKSSTWKEPEDIPMNVIRDPQTSENASLKSLEQDPGKSMRLAEPSTSDLATSAAGVVGDVVSELGETQGVQPTPSEEVTTTQIPPEEARESVSIMKALTNLWADRSAALWKPLDYPLYDCSIIFLTW